MVTLRLAYFPQHRALQLHPGPGVLQHGLLSKEDSPCAGTTSPHPSSIGGHARHAQPGLLSGRCRHLLRILIAVLSVAHPEPGVQILAALALDVRGTSILSPRWLHHFATPPALGRGSSSPRPHSTSLFCCCFESRHPNSCAVTPQCPWWLSQTGRPGEVWPGLWSPPKPVSCAGLGRCVLGTGAGGRCLRGGGGEGGRLEKGGPS